MDGTLGNSAAFPRICLNETSAVELFIRFMLGNRPCIIEASATAHWECRQQWVRTINGRSTIDTNFLIKHYGHMEVPLVKQCIDRVDDNEKCAAEGCAASTTNYSKVKMMDYIKDMEMDPRPKNIGYAKDWHFQQ
ncbi:unnamed protein product [Gongylonema pulchrum]|uniref:Helitron_like_N domain-containing protein n=1 Tax=Gongylonema pulchrum TaxID=637853 RepID=A0A183EGG0_9BILA|nr:unnamed protein product [Gongylonema pulchrum]